MYEAAYFDIPAEVPYWVTLLELAEEWKVPPWQLEDECDLLWFHRWTAYKQELARGMRDRETHGRN